jgi:hypothetical protein
VLYRIDPSPAADGTRLGRYAREATIVLIGCGGTGGFLAEAVCRLLLGRAAQLYLIDPDRVESHNVARQTFLYGIQERWQAWGHSPSCSRSQLARPASRSRSASSTVA